MPNQLAHITEENAGFAQGGLWPQFLVRMTTTWLKQLLRAWLGRLQLDGRGRREKYQRRLDVTREFLARYSIKFLRA